MDKLLQKVCSQQEPLEGWHVVRNQEDGKSRGVVRLTFVHSEARKNSRLYLTFPTKVSDVRQGAQSKFAPWTRLRLYHVTLWSGRCQHCKRFETHHSSDGTCRPLDVKEEKTKILCMTSSWDGKLIAWGDDHGRITIVTFETADVLCKWHAHHQEVVALSFSADDQFLSSAGQDLHGARTGEGLSVEHEATLPRKHLVLLWDVNEWVKSKLKRR